MKLKKIIYSIFFVAMIIAAGTGCRKSQFNINKNINSPTDSTVTYDVVLPAALHASGTIIANQWAVTQRWMGYWARSGTYAPNVIEETYEITTGFGNGIWNNCYDNNYDYNIVQTKAAKAGAGFYEGIARIMKAHNFQILVDVYGNVPYSKALKGGGNPTPSYDKGLDIYKDLFRQVDTAINLIKTTDAAGAANKGIATNDIIFGGNKAKWIRFANTLKLRWLIHCYAVSGINKTAEMAIINTEGSGFLGAGEDVTIQPGYKSDKPNPFYNNFISDVAGTQTANNVYNKANEWGIEYYKIDADPRVVPTAPGGASRYYTAGTGGYVGVAYGLPPINANASPVLAGIGPGIGRRYDSSQNIMIAAESFFLRAEARQRGWITSGMSAQALTEAGMVESFRYAGLASPATALAGYLSWNGGYPDVDYAAGPLNAGLPGGGIYTILSQKWFALNGINTLEVWTDYRRVPYTEVATIAGASSTNFTYGQGAGYQSGPKISVSPQNTSTKIPVRYLYPQTEYNYNTVNVAAEGSVDRYTKIFWDLN